MLAKFAKEKNLSFNKSKYKTLKLMNEKSKFTNAGLLLSDQNPIEVKFIDKFVDETILNEEIEQLWV